MRNKIIFLFFLSILFGCLFTYPQSLKAMIDEDFEIKIQDVNSIVYGDDMILSYALKNTQTPIVDGSYVIYIDDKKVITKKTNMPKGSIKLTKDMYQSAGMKSLSAYFYINNKPIQSNKITITIDKKEVEIGIIGKNKIYDGTTNLEISRIAKYGFLTSEKIQVDISQLSLQLPSKNAGEHIPIILGDVQCRSLVYDTPILHNYHITLIPKPVIVQKRDLEINIPNTKIMVGEKLPEIALTPNDTLAQGDTFEALQLSIHTNITSTHIIGDYDVEIACNNPNYQIHYNGMNKICIVACTGITILSPPNKTRYVMGEDICLTGLTVIQTFSDNSFVDISFNQCTIKNSTTDILGQKEIIVQYKQYTSTFFIYITTPPCVHKYKTKILVKPTIFQKGIMANQCKYCQLYFTKSIPQLTSYELCEAKIQAISSKTYTGKKIRPKVNVYYKNTLLRENIDYYCVYYRCKNVGTASVLIFGKRQYIGSKSMDYKIIPKPCKIKNITKKGRYYIIKCSKVNNISGYQFIIGKKKYKVLQPKIKIQLSNKTKKIECRTYKIKNQKTYYSVKKGVML